MIRILVFSGSIKRGSYNSKLARYCYAMLNGLEEVGDLVYIDLTYYDMPLYNGDYESEHGLPDNAKILKKIFIEADALLIASPEYNSSFTPLLKNTIDWASRPEKGDNPYEVVAFKDKVIGLVSASPGGLGGIRGLVHVRSIFSNIGSYVIPNQASIARAQEAFDDSGNLKDELNIKMVRGVVEQLVFVTQSINADRK